MNKENYSRRDVIKGAALAGGVLGLAALTGCSSGSGNTGASNSSGSGTLTPGTYSASANGMKGTLEVFVTVDDSSITNIEVIDVEDTPVIKDTAIASLKTRILEQQNIEVDTVTGATMTSMGILTAVADALGQAGKDISSFKKGSDAVTNKAQGKTQDYDLVVVGSGMAGMSAALNALRASEDAKILVLEKQAYPGGSTRVCGGGIWAVNAPINQTIGQDSSKDDYISFMEQRSAPTVLNTALMSNIYDVSADAFSYLYNWGLPMSAESWNLGNPNSQLPCFDSSNNLNSNWETGNSGIVDFLMKLAGSNDIEVRVNSKVTDLVLSGNTVTGVMVEDLDSLYTVNAKKVVLASGGFTRNTELIEKYAPDYVNAFAFTGSGGTGDGIKLVESLGTKIVGTGMMGLSGINPSLGYYGPVGGAVWSAQMTINAEGQDFGMKGTFYGDTLALLLKQTNSCGYGIYDSTNAIVERLDAGVEMGVVGKYDTLDDLATDQGIDAAGLKEQAEKNKISQAPFYCIVRRPLFIGSIPGLEVNDQCQILNGSGEAVENLYGAGELIFGNVFSNAYPASGTGVGTSCYTGAVAAKAAMGSIS